MKAIEVEIAKHAPSNFPNLLDGKDELEKLGEEVR